MSDPTRVSGPAGSWALRIGQLHVPSPIRNGSVKDVVLDCDYSLDAGEKPDDIVVKWYLNQESNPSPVYQWIVSKIPQALGVLSGRVDLLYPATDQPSTRHRALRILNPTIELSGEYRCEVSTLRGGEDSKAKKMIIYVPEDNLELTQSKTSVDGQFRLSCEADGVFPKPELTFIKKSEESGGAQILDGAEVRVTDRKDGLFDIEADIVVDEASLEVGSQYAFGCELKIPDADYSLVEWENYEARRPSTTSTPSPSPAPGEAAEVPEGEGGVPLESVHRAVDGKQRNDLHGGGGLAPSTGPELEPPLPCMENVTALKFRSYRLRHQYKVRCTLSGAAALSPGHLSAALALAAAWAWAWARRL
ncbi:Muscle, skeletal receptor tyrosine-protein kinase [Frankliniella fusca]|uniref:Muscle, skeletal receptor tyrosine-protein kinase n=1 Tax=Frankliniella fusca TaxID=407009 RepID=A0AAE1HXH7_9NEOP|nr:Muscle, skeletal receptor tyrosine-protein kinase [Frankliniella fusca]